VAGFKRFRARSFFKNILALLLGLMVALVLLEGLIRTFEPIEFQVRGHKLKLPVNRKYIVKHHGIPNLDQVIYHSTNRLGFRGENPPRNFADYLTIIAVGGSTTNCLYISDGKTWVDLLGKKLEKSFPKFWVNNAGLDGQTTNGHLVLMADIIVELKPKVVLFLVGANDQSYEENKIRDNTFLRKPINSIDKFTGNLLEKSEIYCYIENFYRYGKARNLGMRHCFVDLTKIGHRDVTEEQAAAAKEEHRRKYLKGYADRLRKLIEISRQNGIEPIFMTQPYLLGDGIDDVSGVNLATVVVRSYNGKVAWEILELYNDTLRRICRENQVFVIDLAREMPKSHKFFYDYFHYNNEGAALIAEIIYKHLDPFLKSKYPFMMSRQAASGNE
jgi:lysophospholipase L1-like esterase